MRKRFGYHPVSDIIFDTVYFLFSFFILIGAEKFIRLFEFEEWEYELWSKFKIIMYVFFAILVVRTIINCVLKTHCNYLILTENEIVYHTGWLTKKTTNIQLNKIRSCSKISGPFQRAFGVSNISVTTAGDQPEITFYSIKGGDEAYEIIINMTRS